MGQDESESSGQVKIDQGKLDTIEKIEELPYRAVEALLEGLSTKPADFAIMGLGFVVGYHGLDVAAFIQKAMVDGMNKAIEAAKGAAFKPLELALDLGAIPIDPAGIALEIVRLVGGPALPNKHITPATKRPDLLQPGVSYYGPPPVGFEGEWPPVGTTLSKLQDGKDNASDEDKWKWDLEILLADFKLRMVLGCAGAITAYTLSRPGVLTGMASAAAEGIKGIGEIVPF